MAVYLGPSRLTVTIAVTRSSYFTRSPTAVE